MAKIKKITSAYSPVSFQGGPHLEGILPMNPKKMRREITPPPLGISYKTNNLGTPKTAASKYLADAGIPENTGTISKRTANIPKSQPNPKRGY